MEFQRTLFLFFVFTLFSCSQARKFNVGGSQGWVPNPSENYNQWAGRNRFQINDSLVFKYKKGSDSVLEVKKEDYDKCNKTSPIKKFEDGDTEFKLDRSGPFYFISGKDGNCEKGQKLIVVVLSPRTPPTPKSPPPKVSPLPPPVSPPSSPSPAGQPPSGSPSPAKSPSPAHTSPSPTNLPPAPPPVSTTPSPSPISSPPAPSPATTPSPISSSPPAPTPISNSTASPPRNDCSFVAPSRFLVYSVATVVGAALLRY